MLENLKKLKSIITKREQIQLVGLLFAIIIMSFLQAIGIASVLPFISLIMEPNLIFDNHWLYLTYKTLNFNSINSFIVFTGLAMLFLIIVSNAVSAFATWLKIKFSLMLNHRLSRRLLGKYLNMPYVFFLNRNSADLSNKVLKEVTQLTGNYITPLLTLITRVLVSTFILVLLFYVDIWVTVAAIILLGGTYAFIFWRINRSLIYRGKQQALIGQKRFKAVSEAFGGIKEVKVFNRENHFLDVYSKQSFILTQLNSWQQVIAQLPRFIIEAVAFSGIIIFVLVLMLTQQDSRQVIPLASIFAFAGYRLMPAFSEIFQSAASMKYTQAILDRVYTDITVGINADPLIEIQLPRVSEPLKFEKEIKIEGVSYSYPNANKLVLQNIDLVIKHNKAVAFVGPTGAGKTTLVDIILGLLIPQEGSLSVDGVKITEENVKNWQCILGYVPQHIYLSDDTVMSNIAFGLSDDKIDFEAVKSAARIANIDRFINEELPDKYQTLVGERGVRLSGGQLQRIGIARALYHDPEVLVFDEATSALDGTTEDTVLDALENAARHKTLLIIAHRLTTVTKCDCIYLIDKGMIVAKGTYQELIASNLQFQKMAKITK